ncbi:MAG: hypothetical protein J4N95_07630, partial [Chloroflexi bacterium]|nr:hypothetical protein [Chloroflexota bacterium]
GDTGTRRVAGRNFLGDGVAPDPDQEVRRLAKDAARWRYGKASGITDLDERKRESAWAISSEQRSRLDATLSLAQAERPIADSGVGWDADPWLLGVPNGVVDLRTGEVRAGRQQDRISMQTTVAYDPNAQCPRWLQFIDEVFGSDEELKDWIHRALGYSTTGSTKEQVSFFCFGRGDNGKSTMIRTVRGVLGDYGATTPFSTLEAANRQSIPNDLAALAGRRFVTASEMNEGRRLNEARLKMLCGEDIVSARFLHQEFFEFKPLMKLWLGVNHKPRVEDDSRGLWRKIRLIPFLQSFANRGDKGLEEKLLSESAGILTWLVQGALAWQERGLEPPKAVTIATEAYRLESDRLAEFIEGCCVTGAEFSVKANAIYKQYRDWADEQGLQKQEILSSTKFGTMMGERYDKRREGRGNVYVGIGLRDSGSPLRADREDKSADGLKPSSSGGRIDRSVDNGEDDERDHCFVAAMTVSFPEIALGPGRKIAAGEEVWTQFAQRSGLAAIRTAQAALDQLGREGQRRD